MNTKKINFNKGDYIFKEGAEPEGAYIIISGEFASYKHVDTYTFNEPLIEGSVMFK